MSLKLIKNDVDYEKALDRLNEIFDAKVGSPESDEADVLALLVDEYEKRNFPIEAPDPIEAIKIRMEEMKAQAEMEKAKASSIRSQTNVQINAEGFGQGNYGELMKKLLKK